VNEDGQEDGNAQQKRSSRGCGMNTREVWYEHQRGVPHYNQYQILPNIMDSTNNHSVHNSMEKFEKEYTLT